MSRKVACFSNTVESHVSCAEGCEIDPDPSERQAAYAHARRTGHFVQVHLDQTFDYSPEPVLDALSAEGGRDE